MTGRSLDLQRLRAKLDPLKEHTRDWTEDELVMHLRDWRRMNPNTISQRIRDVRRLGSHPVVPVKLHGTRYELVDSFYAYMRYREEVEHKAPTAIRNDFKAVLSLGDLLGVPREVWPRAPTVPRRARMRLPTPEMVHELLHADYAPDPDHSYEQALVKYLLVLDFGFGLRFPNEAFAMRVQDFDPKDHTIVVREPKKGGSTRRLLIEPQWLCCSKRHASLANFLKWRAKVDVGGSDAFFLKPNGEPFESKFALKRYLDKRVKPRFPWFHLYLGRKWCANARLVEWKFDYARVADWLGHESVDMTRRTYEHESRLHKKLFGDQWLIRAFQKLPTQAPKPETAVSRVFSPVEVDAPAGI